MQAVHPSSQTHVTGAGRLGDWAGQLVLVQPEPLQRCALAERFGRRTPGGLEAEAQDRQEQLRKAEAASQQAQTVLVERQQELAAVVAEAGATLV